MMVVCGSRGRPWGGVLETETKAETEINCSGGLAVTWGCVNAGRVEC